MAENRKYRLDKIAEIKKEMDKPKREKFEKIVYGIIMVSAVILVGLHYTIYLIR